MGGYTGGGCVDAIFAGLTGDGYYSNTGACSNFTSLCNYPIMARYGEAAEWEQSGASHTIYGHVDNSPNHTGCL